MENTVIAGRAVIVMGVSGSGKTLLGKALAAHFGRPFIEGDDLHPPASVARMAGGLPLRDEDRWPWLDAIGTALCRDIDGGVVASCSALRKIYRDRLRDRTGGRVIFLHLTGPASVLRERIGKRQDHFMPASLLDSQLATLDVSGDEPDLWPITIETAPAEQLREAIRLLGTTRR